jgi:hypothetical protein
LPSFNRKARKKITTKRKRKKTGPTIFSSFKVRALSNKTGETITIENGILQLSVFCCLLADRAVAG